MELKLLNGRHGWERDRNGSSFAADRKVGRRTMMVWVFEGLMF